MDKSLLKIFAVIAVIAWFLWPKFEGLNDSFEDKFCKSYVQWNKYAWSAQNLNFDTWSSLEIQEYQRLIEIVESDSPSEDNYISKIAREWFRASSVGDIPSGTAMASILVVECWKFGMKVPSKYIRD